MLFRSVIYIFLISFLFISCSKDVVKKSMIKETNLELQMIEAYEEGLKSLREETLYLSKKFNEAEILFPQSEIAPRAD